MSGEAVSANVANVSGGAIPGSPGALERLHEWIVEHDDSKLFLVLYVGLAVVLSIWISLFWLVAVVAVHFVFELIRQSRFRARPSDVALESVWELKLDIALVLFAFVLTLYMEMVLGVVGLHGAARVGAASKAATRFAGWERTFRGLLLSLDDVAQVVRATRMKRGGNVTDATAAEARGGIADAGSGAVAAGGAAWGSWAGPYAWGAWISLGLAVTCTSLILAAPWLTPHSVASALAALAAELRPLP